ncbi:2-amino-4-hydroxy-6-hydroxymethyldihydropteridine diphosphokinase [Vibrio sp. 99-8-1]|uniref:2-amino-4-hydroxy-6- hydroxymethyldihydropteridine diphosphokinase n=1 Tax=Vibrio sp. 99-8-1 TaxID=2607602 RepID=UPI0014936DC6|nr:2-amino-4-hydroxy-6-hydroxymethyldihydropteridine diphosphokinase [Vibrio sp. 99-8-1]NOI66076.1 2-amino-4-hydroxy-6-hydroxymethyldihydropteridine diphosphokinase [Vibrio sp. 99-8-1]
MITTYIGIGSNVNREYYSQFAVEALSELGKNIVISSVYDCASVDFDSAPFFNFVVQFDTAMSLPQLSKALREIEFKAGRAQDAQKYQDRTLDLDILLFGEEVSSASPQIPRKDIFKYPFVIQPLYDLSPDLCIPDDGRLVKEVWLSMDNLQSLTKADFQFSGC